MISNLIDKKTKLYKFLKPGRAARKPRFDEQIWSEALTRLAEFNCSRYYFDFEDRLIEEIVLSIVDLPVDMARAEMVRMKSIVDRESEQASHGRSFVLSIRNAVAGAVSVGLKFLA